MKEVKQTVAEKAEVWSLIKELLTILDEEVLLLFIEIRPLLLFSLSLFAFAELIALDDMLLYSEGVIVEK